MNWDDFRAYSSRLAAWLAWVPDWLVGLALLAAAALVALLIHRWAIGLLERLVGAHQIFVASLLRQTRGPTRLAIVIAALSLTLQATAFNPVLAQVLGHALAI